MTQLRPVEMLPGARVLRVVWVPGTDLLQGHCWCGATQVAEDPIRLWDWLAGHPEGHDAGGGAAVPLPQPAARLVPA